MPARPPGRRTSLLWKGSAAHISNCCEIELTPMMTPLLHSLFYSLLHSWPGLVGMAAVLPVAPGVPGSASNADDSHRASPVDLDHHQL